MVDAHTGTDGWGGLQCVMRERVLVSWHERDEEDERYFGCLCEAGDECEDCKGNLSLEVHRSGGDDQAVMVKFHLPVKVPASRSKQPKDMYVILPASSLSMERVFEDSIPENVRTHLPPAVSHNRIHLELGGSELPYAVMPEIQRRPRQIGRRVTGTARKMIMCLKSLCNAKSWDVFLVGDGIMQDQVDDVCRLLRGGVSEPKLDLASIYNDGIRGLINSWQDYPYLRDEQPTHRHLSPVPPSYGEIAEGKAPPAFNPDGSSGSELYWRTSPSPNRKFFPGQAAATAKRKKAEAGSSSDEGAETHKHPRQMTSHSTSESDGHPGDRMADFQRQLALAQELSPTEADPESAPPHDAADAAESPAVPADEISATPPDVSQIPGPRLPSPPAPVQPAQDGAGHAQPCHGEGGCGLYLKMAQLILYASRRDPLAPTRYAKEFLEMGRHVNSRNEGAFRTVKARCFDDLSDRAARRQLPARPSSPVPSGARLRERTKALLDWLDREISDEAYLYVDRHFVRLKEVALKAETGGAAAGVREEFEVREADFYAAAFRVADGVGRGNARRPPFLCAGCITCLSRAYSSFR